MRLIIPLILIALMLPYAMTDDEPSGEWLIQPDPTMGLSSAATVDANELESSDRANDAISTAATTRPIVRVIAIAAAAGHDANADTDSAYQ